MVHLLHRLYGVDAPASRCAAVSDFCGIGFDVLSVILRATFWVNWVQYSPYFNNTCTLARFEAVQRRVCQIITGGGIHRPTAVTVVLLSWTVFRLVVNSKPKNCSIRSSTSQNIAYCYLNTDLLPTAREQSVTDRLRSANKLPRIICKD